MKAIVAVDLNWGIGCGGKLLQMIPEDMKFFKEKTLGKIVVMGRETFESLPGKAPLKDRINIVLSKSEFFKDDRIIICRSLNELFHEIEKYDTDDVFIIGGESVYTQFLSYCSEAYLTKIENTYLADKKFANLDKEKTWERVSISDSKNYNNIQYSFLKYVNNQLINYNK
ncbi:dihydrofolate reductase [Clostridium tagluense]|uniref:dihydrofolate reductase n=1 Tax=Clostridium tagluense TaxID=360422 RepID=UPI001CF0F3E3|nr:dihydrofolate reductase [Clostridium tagluense]MCB2300885.1 dihydrofolate reductase [Clostridium tagluense]